jgi:hypothetical protein
MPVVTLALADALAAARHSPRARLRSYAHHLPTAVVAAALALTTTLPVSALTEAETYRKPAEVTARERMLATVPDGASVEANIGPISRLTSRCRVFWLGNTRGTSPDYIALDNTRKWLSDVEAYVRRLHPRATYTVEGSTDGYLLLKRQP